MSANLTSGEQGQWRAWCRILRPLLLWIAGLGLTLGYLEFQRLSERTRLRGEIYLESRPANLEAVVELDGKPYDFERRVSFGSHRLAIRHPKADPFVTNLFVWLGDRDLGRLELRRAQGKIEIQVDPPARQIDVAGPEWRQQFTNGNGLTVTVPTDRYTVTARYQYFSFKQDVEVERDQIASCTIFPQVGALQVSSIHPETTYALALPDGTGMEEGKLPTTFQNLATGKYLLRSRYKGIPREWPVEVLSGQTNVLEIRYPFGTLAVTTTPPGAKVLDESGESRGQTPVSLSEVPVGRWQGQIELEGYVPVKIDTEIQTNAVTTIDQRLLKRAFVEAMDTAQQALKRPNPDYAAAIAALELALKEEPGEPNATKLLRQSRLNLALETMRRAYEAQDLRTAIQQGELALELEPQNESVQRLIGSAKQNIREMQAKADEAAARQEVADREQRAKEFFAELMQNTLNSQYFEEQRQTVPGRLADFEAKLIRALTNQQPAFKLETQDHPKPLLGLIRAKLPMGIKGWRRVDLVCSQTAENRIIVIYKVFDYAYPVTQVFGMVLGTVTEKSMLPIHESRVIDDPAETQKRRTEGIGLVRERIRQAMSQ